MKSIKKYKNYLLSFFIPIFLIAFVFFLNNREIEDFITGDSREQYIYLFQYLKEMMNQKESLFYSFERSLGGPMYTTFFYYLSSPFNLLLILFREEQIPLFIFIVTLLKIGLSGASMYFYLSKTNNKQNLWYVVFAISYALMDYNILYYFQSMWLDIVLLTPLVIYGLDQLIQKNKSKFYIIMLSLSLYSNFYISYMLCIFCTLYTLYQLILLKYQKAEWKRVMKKFITSSILCVLMMMFVLLPVLSELKMTYRNAEYLDEFLGYNLWNSFLGFTIIKSSLYPHDFFTPQIFTSGFILCILIFYFFFSKNKNKKIDCIFLCFLFLNTIFVPLVKLWHGMDIPASCFHRWSSFISFFMIKIASDHYKEVESISFSKIAKLAFGYCVFVILIFLLSSRHTFSIKLLFANLYFFLAEYYILKYQKKKNWNIVALILLVLELFTSLKMNFITNNNFKKRYDNCFIQNQSVLINEVNQLEDPNSYRIGQTSTLSMNETFNSEIGSLHLFLSNNQKRMISFLKTSGYDVSQNEIYDNQNQTVLNSLLGIRYWYGNEEAFAYPKINSYEYCNGESNIYLDEKALKVGYMIENNKVEIDATNPFVYQNSFAETLGGEIIWKRIEYQKANENYLVQNGGKDIYVFIAMQDGEKVIDLSFHKQKYAIQYPRIIKLNSDQEESLVKISNIDQEEVYFYTIEDTAFQKLIKKLKVGEIDVINKEKNRMKFQVYSEKENTLLLTIPYDKNWEVFRNGKKVKAEEIFETFLGVPLNEGQNEVTIIYKNEIIIPSIFISIFSFAITAFYLKKERL